MSIDTIQSEEQKGKENEEKWTLTKKPLAITSPTNIHIMGILEGQEREKRAVRF